MYVTNMTKVADAGIFFVLRRFCSPLLKFHSRHQFRSTERQLGPSFIHLFRLSRISCGPRALSVSCLVISSVPLSPLCSSFPSCPSLSCRHKSLRLRITEERTNEGPNNAKHQLGHQHRHPDPHEPASNNQDICSHHEQASIFALGVVGGGINVLVERGQDSRTLCLRWYCCLLCQCLYSSH